MTRLACVRAGVLLERRSAGLSAAESLRLEEHLAGCDRCASDASLLGGLRALAHEPDGMLTPIAREHAIATAFAQTRVEHRTSSRFTLPQALALGGAFAAAFVLALSMRPGRQDGMAPALAAKPAQSSPAPAVVVASTSAAQATQDAERDREGEDAVSSSAPRPPDGVLRAPDGATVILAHAEVELRPGTEARWDREHRTLSLERGSVLADVDPNAHQRFSVKAPGFEVVVLGTRFEVTLERVRVLRGRVRVLAPDGRVLEQALGPGEQFALDQGGRAAAQAVTPRRARDTRPQEPAASLRGDGSTALLESARTALAAKQVARARELVDEALRLGPASADRAEALSLRAECALVEGRLEDAIAGYMQVADSFAALGAGENALFAAARLEKTRGHRDAAVQDFTRYLARYPKGRFVKEANARLRELTP